MPQRTAIAIILATFCMTGTRVLGQESEPPAVLTVCEALRGISLYGGKTVVIVRQSGFTFEGSFLHEKCDPDDHILIQGHRWLSMIAVGSETRELSAAFPVNDEIIQKSSASWAATGFLR
jgi:hypothetical protein